MTEPERLAHLVTAVIAGDEPAFAAVTARHRRELHVHCYRMLASFEEAEDAVQETLLRAWRHRDRLDEGAQPRAWLYRIATNVCLDALRARKRRPVAADSMADVPWLEPYPDQLLDEVAAAGDEPGERAVSRETIELSFLAALQTLPPRQRAALIARDVHGWSARETAEMLSTSVAAANSALQRARATLEERPPARSTTRYASDEDRLLLQQFVDAHERGDAALAVSIAASEIRVTMPPMPMCFDGIHELEGLLEHAFGDGGEGDWRLVPTMANRMPAAASYLRRHGDSVFRAYKLDVLRIAEGLITEITTFGYSQFPRFGLADAL
jgi:RNA polymerase sigma-70 factor (ECF subfamily)